MLTEPISWGLCGRRVLVVSRPIHYFAGGAAWTVGNAVTAAADRNHLEHHVADGRLDPFIILLAVLPGLSGMLLLLLLTGTTLNIMSLMGGSTHSEAGKKTGEPAAPVQIGRESC